MRYRELKIGDLPLTQVAELLSHLPQVKATADTIEDLMNSYECIRIEIPGMEAVLSLVPTWDYDHEPDRQCPTWRAVESVEMNGHPGIIQMSTDERSPADALLAALQTVNICAKIDATVSPA